MMASKAFMVVIVAISVAAAPAAAARTINNGVEDGWKYEVDYQQWTEAQQFNAGGHTHVEAKMDDFKPKTFERMRKSLVDIIPTFQMRKMAGFKCYKKSCEPLSITKDQDCKDQDPWCETCGDNGKCYAEDGFGLVTIKAGEGIGFSKYCTNLPCLNPDTKEEWCHLYCGPCDDNTGKCTELVPLPPKIEDANIIDENVTTVLTGEDDVDTTALMGEDAIVGDSE